MAERRTGVVGVFPTRQVARVAAAAAERAGADPAVIRIADRDNQVVDSNHDVLEFERVYVAPGGPAPVPLDLTDVLVPLTTASATAGALGALPFASLHFSGIGLWGRVLIVGIVGAAIGANAGFVLGARRTRRQLSYGLGVTVAIDDAPPGAIEALRALQPIRLETIEERFEA